MLEALTLGISIGRPWRDVYDADLAAGGLPEVGLRPQHLVAREGRRRWRAAGPEGTVRIRFTDHNPFGVMDHYVDTGDGPEVYVPMRVIANGDGAEVLLTLFRQPGMSDAKLAADAEWVRRDLLALRALLTG